MGKKRKKPQRGRIHVPDGMQALLSDHELEAVKRRIDRKTGSCGVCHQPLGRTRDLAFVLAPHQVDNITTLAGSWQITTTHRACRREEIADTATLLPQHTYTTMLMALPVVNAEGVPDQVPTMLINPTVDHIMVTKKPDGAVVDGTVDHLVRKAGFACLADGDDTPEIAGLEAYVSGANVTVASNELGISWTHEQSGPPHVVEHMGQHLKSLLEGWDNTLMVMVSTQFRLSNPKQVMRRLPELMRSNHVYSAPAAVTYRDSPVDLVQKAFTAAMSPSADSQ